MGVHLFRHCNPCSCAWFDLKRSPGQQRDKRPTAHLSAASRRSMPPGARRADSCMCVCGPWCGWLLNLCVAEQQLLANCTALQARRKRVDELGWRAVWQGFPNLTTATATATQHQIPPPKLLQWEVKGRCALPDTATAARTTG